jgi:hypothetical protein
MEGDALVNDHLFVDVATESHRLSFAKGKRHWLPSQLLTAFASTANAMAMGLAKCSLKRRGGMEVFIYAVSRRRRL